MFASPVDSKLKEICGEIIKLHEIKFLEIGGDDDHVHFPVQSVPLYSPKRIVQNIKSITAREVFRACPEVKQYLWGGKFWSEGYFVGTVGAHGNVQMIKNYVRQQGKVESNGQRKLFNLEFPVSLAPGRKFLLSQVRQGVEMMFSQWWHCFLDRVFSR